MYAFERKISQFDTCFSVYRNLSDIYQSERGPESYMIIYDFIYPSINTMNVFIVATLQYILGT